SPRPYRPKASTHNKRQGARVSRRERHSRAGRQTQAKEGKCRKRLTDRTDQLLAVQLRAIQLRVVQLLVARPTGIEPVSRASETLILSIELRALEEPTIVACLLKKV